MQRLPRQMRLRSVGSAMTEASIVDLP